MKQGADVADQMVQEGVQVSESAIKLAGIGVKNLAIILLQLLQDNKKLKGKTGLNNLLQSNKPLVAFTMDKAKLAEFKEKAEDYGVLFSSVHSKGKNGQCDIMVKAEDSATMHRIFESLQQETLPAKQNSEGKSNPNWLQQTVERFTEPTKRFEGKTGPLEGLGAETLAALVYQLAAENREFLEASPLSFVFEEGKSLEFAQVPDFCKKDVLEQAEILGLPVHFQASETQGKLTMLAKSEDAPILNRLFENLGLEKPMQAEATKQAEEKSIKQEVAPPSKNETSLPAEKTTPVKNDSGRTSVKVEFSKAQEKSKAGKSPVAVAHRSAKAKAAVR